MRYKPLQVGNAWYAILYDGKNRRVKAVECKDYGESAEICRLENDLIRLKRRQISRQTTELIIEPIPEPNMDLEVEQLLLS